MQCTSNAYFSIAYSIIKKSRFLKSWSLDYIFGQGDIFFKSVGIGHPLSIDTLPINFKIENFDLNGVILDHKSHLMQGINDLSENYRYPTQKNIGDGEILTSASFSVAVMWSKTSVFLFDFQICKDQGFHDNNGKAKLPEFRSMTSLNNFLKTFFIQNVSQ